MIPRINALVALFILGLDPFFSVSRASMKWISHLLHLASLSRALGYNVQTHDASFTPDIILRTSLENTELHCRTRLTAVVNGTVPGPELRIPEGKTTWIRVYNDMTDQNTTIHWHGLTYIMRNLSNLSYGLTDQFILGSR